MADHYLTIRELSVGEFKDKGSRFVGYVFPIQSMEDFDMEMEKIKKEHFKARHHCYAHTIGHEDPKERSNDDGEPSGTAGLPILGQLKSNQLNNVGAVVVRYFGGTKLGTSGLIQAYKGATKEAISQSEIYEFVISLNIKIAFDYSLMGPLMNTLKKQELDIVDKSLTAEPYLIIRARESIVEAQMNRLKSALLNITEEEYLSRKVKDVPGIKFQILKDA